MNEINTKPKTNETVAAEDERPAGTNGYHAETAREEPPRRGVKPMYIALGILAVVLVGVAALVWTRYAGSGGGQPVPAPRTVSMDDAGEGESPALTGQTVRIQPEQIESSGIAIETVGEQLTTETEAASATGVVQANAYRETPAIALAGGVVRRIGVELGQPVSRGQTIAVVFSDEFAETQSRLLALNTQVANARQNLERRERLVALNQPGRTEFDAATKQLTAAEAQLDEMRKRYQRTVRLVEIGAASRQDLEEDNTKLRTAEAETVEARRRLERSRTLLDIRPETRGELEEAQNALRQAESERSAVRQKLILYGLSPQRIDALRSPSQISSELAVTAPVSGTVTARAVNAGEVVEANKELLRVTDLSSVWVIAQAFEPTLARLRTGTGASVTSDAFPERLFRGQVTYIDPRLDEQTRTAQVRVELDNPGQTLKIGMYVRVAFGALGQAERTAPVIPAAALQTIGNRQIVFVATKEAGVFELRPVRVGPETNGQHIVIEGLTVGDRIATAGSFMLRAEWLKSNQSGS